ncbi:hypothetical protein ACPVPU_11150 [Sphingomonas sp. CJ99]
MSIDQGKQSTVTLFEQSSDGHRLSYIAYFAAHCDRMGRNMNVETVLRNAVLAPGPLILPMLEQRTLTNLATMAFRSIMGRPTLCLVFRASYAVRSTSMSLRIKRALMRLVRSLPRAGLVSIVPVDADPAIAPYVNDWIYDPELCDLSNEQLMREPGEMAARLRALAGRRMIVTAIGTQSADKGFDYFANLWHQVPSLRDRFLFVSAGRVVTGSDGAAAQFESDGGMLINRRIDDDELLDLYKASDLIWCCYAPSYDQASGIFGRAVQFAKTAILRQGSISQSFATVIDQPSIALPWNQADEAARQLSQYNASDMPKGEKGHRNDEMRKHNESVINRYLEPGHD